jgi:4-amino-4-deoxy-L-arabinose transferase-like glycosyltransferase
MKKFFDISSIGPYYLDLICFILLIGLNPVSYFLSLSPGIFPPDSFTYATMARNFFLKGLLFIPSWGHVDSGLILPPLYPLLIACGRMFSQETLIVAEFVSSLSMLAFTIPMFFFIKKMTNRWVAVITIFIIQINYYFLLIGTTPLSESVFLLTTGLTLWLLLEYLDYPSNTMRVLSFVIGILCTSVFFSRQIGVVIYFFMGILFLLQYIIIKKNQRRTLVTNYFFVFCGSLVLLLPYVICLYIQTNQHPLTQGFRKGEYSIKISDPKILHEIQQEKNLPSELEKIIESQPDNNYGMIYAERRQMRKLLTDSSEMYDYVTAGDKTKDSKMKNLLSNFLDPGAFLIRIYNNILHLKSVLGGFTTILFLLLCAASLSISLISFQTDKIKIIRGFLLPSFILFYMIMISLLTDKIARYIYIIFPFCIMYISIESYKILSQIKSRFKNRYFKALILIFIFTSILVTTPKFFTGLELKKKYIGIENQYGFDFKKITNGEPVFSLLPYETYMIGSPYRILPNDSLEKVAIYGKKTGVHWILIFHSQSSEGELQFYTKAAWYSNPRLGKAYPDIVKFRLGTKDGAMALYEIL